MRGVNPKIHRPLLRWDIPAESCALADDEVHVWAADLDGIALVREFAHILSPDETERAARFHFQRDRRNFITARGLLRTILADYAKVKAADLQFSYSTNGKPSLALVGPAKDLTFNLSHSDGVALYAISRNRGLGIDLESLQPFSDMHEIAERCFSPEEKSSLRELESPQQEEKFFRYWTRKEAILKCSGEGFSDAIEKFDALSFDGTIHELQPADNYVATLAVYGKSFTLKTWRFDDAAFV